MPAYESADLVSETLTAVARQTYEPIKVLISVDASTDGTVEACRAFERDERFRVFAQDCRLGWVANTNFLLDRVETEFFLVMPHDDLVADDYVGVLYEAAVETPSALVAYADAEDFGAGQQVRRVVGLEGPVVERVSALLASSWTGGPWRGLTRSSVLEEARMVDNTFEGFGADALWALTLLCRGPFKRVPRVLYRKRIIGDGSSLVQDWQARGLEERFARWAEHSAACLRTIREAPATEEERLRLILIQIARALQTGPGATSRRRPDDQRRREELVMLATLTGRSLGISELSSEALLSLRRDRPLWQTVASLGAQ